MLKLLVAGFLTVCFAVSGVAQFDTIEVGILRGRIVKRIILQAKVAPYMIEINGKAYNLNTEDGLSIKYEKGVLHAKTLTQAVHTRGAIKLIPRSGASRIRIRSSSVDVASRTYQGIFHLEPTSQGIQCMVHVPLEEYVAGVVQSESGKGRAPEYYKLQAIISRTYVLANQKKHAHDGFHVCDQTHCQVFKGYGGYEKIQDAVKETERQVAVDSDIQFIDATFHSNCGGETVSSEDVWSKEVSYLRSVHDKYCREATHSDWNKEISKVKWLEYLRGKFGLDISLPANVKAVLDYNPVCRDIYFANLYPYMPVEDIRADFGLKSTYFSVKEKGGVVTLTGKGFGHGVGLCQEGAMVMALTDRSFREIMHHYFSDVHIVDIKALDFFRDEKLTDLHGDANADLPRMKLTP